MNRFALLLKSINEKLDLPQPRKSRILLEIAADLEDLFDVYRTKGFSEAEAMRKAEEKFVLNEEAIFELIQIHESVFRRFLDKLSEQAKTRWERALLIVILLFIVAFGAKQTLTVQFFLQASKFIWLVLGIALSAAILSLAKFYNIYLEKDHRITKLHTGLPAFLFLAGASLVIGAYGLFIELYLSACKMIDHAEKTFFFTIQWLVKSSSLIVFSLLVAIFAALIWFIFYNKVKKIERAEITFLLRDQIS